MAHVNVFYLKPTNRDDEPERPDIDISDRRNQGANWEILSEVFYHGRRIEDYQEIAAIVNCKNVLEYHAYGFIGCGRGFFSPVVVDVLKSLIGDAVTFLPVSINGSRFFAPYVTPKLDYLDQSASRIVTFPSNPKKVMTVEFIVFDQCKLFDPLVFMVPGIPALLITDTVAAALARMNLRGLDIFEVKAVRPAFRGFVKRSVAEVLSSG